MQNRRVLTIKRRWFEDAEVGTVWAVRVRKEKKVKEKLPDSEEKKLIMLSNTSWDAMSFMIIYKSYVCTKWNSFRSVQFWRLNAVLHALHHFIRSSASVAFVSLPRSRWTQILNQTKVRVLTQASEHIRVLGFEPRQRSLGGMLRLVVLLEDLWNKLSAQIALVQQSLLQSWPVSPLPSDK